MLNKIIEFSIKNKLIIILMTLGLIIYGLFELKNLPSDAVPDITDSQVEIVTVSPSLGAPDVERFITFPLEQINNNIQGIKEMRSFSRFGLSVITIVFEDNIDLMLARQQVAERLQQVSKDIPTNLGVPQMAPITTGLGEIYQYVVRPKKGYEHRFDAMELRTIQDWIIRRQLLGTPGVADVASFGGNLKQYEVAVNPSVLKSMGVTITEVFDALQNNKPKAFSYAYGEDNSSIDGQQLSNQDMTSINSDATTDYSTIKQPVQQLITKPWENMWFRLGAYDKARRLPQPPYLPNYKADILLNSHLDSPLPKQTSVNKQESN